MLQKYLTALVLILDFYNKSQKIDNNLGFQIEDAISYRFDLINEVYTVDYKTSPKNFKFKLSDKERKEIIGEYYSLNLEDLTQNTFIEDQCNRIPKLFTTLFVKSKSATKIIIIDVGCKEYSFLNRRKAERIKKFINLIEQTILKKPELKLAPKTSAVYQ